jgi:hypothetical protein
MEPAILQTGPERFRVMFGDGRQIDAQLAHEFRRAIAPGVPPLQVATEVFGFAREHDVLPPGATSVDLAAVIALVPGWVDELRARFG